LKSFANVVIKIFYTVYAIRTKLGCQRKISSSTSYLVKPSLVSSSDV